MCESGTCEPGSLWTVGRGEEVELAKYWDLLQHDLEGWPIMPDEDTARALVRQHASVGFLAALQASEQDAKQYYLFEDGVAKTRRLAPAPISYVVFYPCPKGWKAITTETQPPLEVEYLPGSCVDTAAIERVLGHRRPTSIELGLLIVTELLFPKKVFFWKSLVFDYVPDLNDLDKPFAGFPKTVHTLFLIQKRAAFITFGDKEAVYYDPLMDKNLRDLVVWHAQEDEGLHVQVIETEQPHPPETVYDFVSGEPGTRHKVAPIVQRCFACV